MMMQPWLTLDQAISWAMCRDNRALSIAPLTLAAMQLEPSNGLIALMRADEAIDEIWRYLQEGTISAIAGGGEQLLPEQFATVTILHRQAGYVAEMSVDDGRATTGEHFRLLRLKAKDVEAQFPVRKKSGRPDLTLIPKTPPPRAAPSRARIVGPGVTAVKAPPPRLGRPPGSTSWDNSKFLLEYCRRLAEHGEPQKPNSRGWDSKEAAAASVLEWYEREMPAGIEPPAINTAKAWAKTATAQWIDAGRPRKPDDDAGPRHTK